VVLHEVFGVNADLRMTCDALAAAGFLAVSPDLFWRQTPGVDLSVTSEADWNTRLALYAAYDRDAGVTEIVETIKAAAHLESASGKVAVMGYCLGGLMAFLTAARSRVDAVVAFHGGDTEKYLDEAPAIVAPMIMHLGDEDEFISKAAQAQIKAALADRPNAQIYTYAGCNHAFSRHGGSHYNAKAAEFPNTRTLTFLRTELSIGPLLRGPPARRELGCQIEPGHLPQLVRRAGAGRRILRGHGHHGLHVVEHHGGDIVRLLVVQSGRAGRQRHLDPGQGLGAELLAGHRPVGAGIQQSRRALGLRMQLHQEIDEDIGQVLRRALGRAGVDRIVRLPHDLGLMRHERVGDGVLVGEEAVEGTDLRFGPGGDLRHGRGFEPTFLEHGRRRLDQFGDALAADLALRRQRAAIPT
jgi:carboxymethylenebutenolidase